MKTIIGTLALVLALSTPALAMHERGGNSDKWGEENFFPDMTESTPSIVTWDMFKAEHPNLTRADFDRLDMNNDGVLRGDELNTYGAVLIHGTGYGDTDDEGLEDINGDILAGSHGHIGIGTETTNHNAINSRYWDEKPFFMN